MRFIDDQETSQEFEIKEMFDDDQLFVRFLDHKNLVSDDRVDKMSAYYDDHPVHKQVGNK